MVVAISAPAPAAPAASVVPIAIPAPRSAVPSPPRNRSPHDREASAADESTPGSEVAEFGVELLRVAEDCGIDPDTVDSPLGSDAFAYGDDPELDARYDACAAGDSVACDDLYINSPAGSDYEQFGGTCGGRFEYSDSELCEGRF